MSGHNIGDVELPKSPVLREPLVQVGKEEATESETGADGVGVVAGGSQQGSQKETQQGIDQGPLGRVVLEGQKLFDLIESGIAGLSSSDGGDGGVNVSVGGVQK